MYKRRHRRGRRLASVVLAAAMIVTAVPAQAAEFDEPDSFEELFSSGGDDYDTGSVWNLQQILVRKQIHRRYRRQ